MPSLASGEPEVFKHLQQPLSLHREALMADIPSPLHIAKAIPVIHQIPHREPRGSANGIVV